MRPYNFSAGPAMLPETVLAQAAAEMTDWQGCRMSVMELSHRGREFDAIIRRAQDDLRDLLEIPVSYRILFMQGGATAMNAIIPMNLVNRPGSNATMDFVHTGIWSGKSLNEAGRYGNVNVAASSGEVGFLSVPAQEKWQMTDNAAYVHVCANETINGNQFHFTPDTGAVPLVADMSSEILSRPVDFSKYGVIFAGAQKNLGPAGVTVLVVREDLIGYAVPFCPSVFDWKNLAENNSMFNTPPTYAIYICGLVLRWLKKRGGVSRMEQESIEKSSMLYDFIDRSGFYRNEVSIASRSRMNVPFFLEDESLNDEFVAEAAKNGLLQLKGHRLAGGMRASLYNAMPIEGVKALVAFMRAFERKH